MIPELVRMDLEIALTRKANAIAEKVERENSWMSVEDGEARIYMFTGEVDEESVTDAIDGLDTMSRRSPGQDITIVFNTNGGHIFDGMALYDFILELRGREHSITTVALGSVFSMGSILLQAGTRREMSKHSYMMIHEAATDAGYLKVSGMRDEVKLLDRLERQGYAVLAERSTLSAAEIKARADRRDWFLDADEAVALGLADAVRR